jgi:hypothetical protein
MSETYQLLTKGQIAYHDQNNVKYRPSSIGKLKPGSRPKLPEISMLDLM